MKLNPRDLENIADLTLEHYNQCAEDFWEGTRDHNVSQNIEALLETIEGKPPFAILDFGCGPGRDLKVFAELGHLAIGLDGAAHFAEMARVYSGCVVWCSPRTRTAIMRKAGTADATARTTILRRGGAICLPPGS